MRGLITGMLIILLISSCQLKSDQKKSDSSIEVDAILSENETLLRHSYYNEWLLDNRGYKYFEPDTLDLVSLQIIIRNTLLDQLEYSSTEETVDLFLNDYYRQYTPYLDSLGNKIIEVNAFCERPKFPHDKNNAGGHEFDWRYELLIANDGGMCYWQMKINLNSKQHFEFWFNGD